MKTKNIWIIALMLMIYLDLAASNFITAQKYKYLDETSNSLQEIIYEYHNYISDGEIKFIFDLKSRDDGYDEDAGVFNSHFQVDKDEYIGAGIGLKRLIIGGQNFAYITRQIGSDSDRVDPETKDNTIVTRLKYLDDSVDILIGLNLHTEPNYRVEDGVTYFTSTEGATRAEFVYSVKYNNINLNMLINEEFTPEQTILSYRFDTEYGEIIPRALYGINSESNYYDYYIDYNSLDIFDDNRFFIKGSMKGRYIVDGGSEVSKGTHTAYIEIEKMFSQYFKLYVGVSISNEFTQGNSFGHMYKLGIAAPKKYNNLKWEFYLGRSYNYYPDLQEIQLIDQDVNTLGVMIHI